MQTTARRMVSYREHLIKTAGKLKNRNNLLMKLAGSTWAPVPTLCGHLLWRFAVQQQSTAPQSGHTLLTQVRKSDRCAVELYHAPHLWYSPFYTGPMTFSALQH